MTRIELVTSSLPRKRSTPELHRLLLAGLTSDSIKNRIKTQKSCLLFADETPVNNNILTKLQGWKLSGRPGSNWRHSAWKADALPTELLPLLKRNTMASQAFNFKKPQSQFGNGSDCRHLRVKKSLWGEQDSNLRRRSQQIYSLPSLAAWVSPLFFYFECIIQIWINILKN